MGLRCRDTGFQGLTPLAIPARRDPFGTDVLADGANQVAAPPLDPDPGWRGRDAALSVRGSQPEK